VHEADIVRVLTFACVIAVHTVSNTNSNASTAANAVVMLLHFTREAFFVLTAFVLVHSYLGRPASAVTMWRRRIPAVLIPYTVWTVFYTGLGWYEGARTETLGSWLHALGDNYLYGTAWYHIYFLLVSLQIYLLYPLIEAIVRRAAGHHGALLAISGTLQLALLSALTYWPPSHGWLHGFAVHDDVLIVTYQFYVFLGAVAAMHIAAVRSWIGAHPLRIVAGLALAGALAECWYQVAARRELPSTAAAALQPVTMIWSIAVVAALFAIGEQWAKRRRPGSLPDRILTVGSDRSFGIYLVHPAVLWLVLWSAGKWLPRHLHGLPLTLLAYAATVAGSIALTEVMRRSWLSLPLTGRPHRRRAAPSSSAAQLA
jgi:peptidoglycan/LPS O-acetylase OafA/YrhL